MYKELICHQNLCGSWNPHGGRRGPDTKSCLHIHSVARACSYTKEILIGEAFCAAVEMSVTANKSTSLLEDPN